MSSGTKRVGFWAMFSAAVVVGGTFAVGCGMKSVSVPELSGPSEMAISLLLTVNPDVLTADGYSTALVRAEVRGIDGQPRSGVDVFFALADESGYWADLGTLRQNRVITDGRGIAETIYTAPPRTDATANQTLLIVARPVLNDANAAIYRSVRMELRSAETRLFPQNPNNTKPNCSFVTEPPAGPYYVSDDVLFQSTSSDPDGTIIRYYWDFGDGHSDDKPDVAHRYGSVGLFTVTHVVTDDDGLTASCTQALTIQ